MMQDINLNHLCAILVDNIDGNKCVSIEPEYIRVCNIHNSNHIQHTICNLSGVPHIAYINGDKEPYMNYMKNAGEHAGYGLEHSFENFDNLIKNFKYLEKPYENEYIECKIISQKLVIVNGLHRASILKTLNQEKVKVKIILG